MTWNDITLAQYIKILEVNKVEDNDEQLNTLITTLLGIEDPENHTIAEYSTHLTELSFLSTKPIPAKLRDVYKLNGRVYDLDMTPQDFSVAQFIDHSNYSKEVDLVGVMTTILIPFGHNYNDGYDVDLVRQDIESMKMVDFLAINNFFVTFVRKFASAIRRYSHKKKIPAKIQKELNTILRKLPEVLCPPMASSH